MLDNDRGVVYGLVGVIGSGKSYRGAKLYESSIAENRDVIVGDFSDGIRETVMNILAGRNIPIDVNSREYLYWKNKEFEVHLPGQPDENITGRLLLKRTGEFLKQLAGQSVWADFTAKKITEEWTKLNDFRAFRANIIFGSLRFPEEAEALFKIAKMTSKSPRIIFCDYRSPYYELNDHISEKLAQHFVRDDNFSDGDIITEEVQNLLYSGL